MRPSPSRPRQARPPLVDTPELYRRAGRYLTVLLGLDADAWRALRADRIAAVEVLACDLRRAAAALGKVLSTRPASGVDLSELAARRWAVAWLLDAVAPVLRGVGPGDDRWELARAAEVAQAWLTGATRHLTRRGPRSLAVAQRNAILRITAVAAIADLPPAGAGQLREVS